MRLILRWDIIISETITIMFTKTATILFLYILMQIWQPVYRSTIILYNRKELIRMYQYPFTCV